MSHDPRFRCGIPLWTPNSIRTPARGKYPRAVPMATNDVWFIEGDPMLYAVSESFEADTSIAFVVGNYIARE